MLDSRDISTVCNGVMGSPVKKANGNSRRKRTPSITATNAPTNTSGMTTDSTPTRGKSQPVNIAGSKNAQSTGADINFNNKDHNSGGSSDGSLPNNNGKRKGTVGASKHKTTSGDPQKVKVAKNKAGKKDRLNSTSAKAGKNISSSSLPSDGKFGTAGNSPSNGNKNNNSKKNNNTNNNNNNNNNNHKKNASPRVQAKPQCNPADFYAAGDYSYSAPEPSALPPPPMGWLSNNSPLVRSSGLVRGGVRSYESSPTMVSDKEAYDRSTATNDLRTLLHVA